MNHLATRLLNTRLAMRLLRSPVATKLLSLGAGKRLRDLAPKAFRKDGRYGAYLEAQVKKSFAKARRGRWRKRGLGERTRVLVELVSVHAGGDLKGGRALCVGCRDANELDHIENILGMNAVGLDLFSGDPRILVGDMHRTEFDSDSFDLLYSCHSLEHAYDCDSAIAEFCRVLKPGGVLAVEVPVNFQVNDTDYWDFGNVDNLIGRLGDRVAEVCYKKTEESISSGKPVIRLVARVR